MLYQIHPDGNPRVVRFGSKGLTKWQSSYRPTKLELLGVVTAILDFSSYLNGKHFTVECDHQALKPLFQQARPNDVWTCVARSNMYIIYKIL
jgi:hypothetical protein